MTSVGATVKIRKRAGIALKDMFGRWRSSRRGKRAATEDSKPNWRSVEQRATACCQGCKIMELGIFSFADVQRDPNSGTLGSTADAMRNLREAIALADAVGLAYFGVG